MDDVRLVVGLGNPGPEYARTRHNAGFLVVERLAQDWKTAWQVDAKHQVRLAAARWSGARCWLCQPLTYMNSSGAAVSALVGYYHVALERLLVVVDDADLPLGELRMRPGGGNGGHHGLESIERSLGSQAYPRLRLGIGRRAEDDRQIVSHVLGRFSPAESEWFDQVVIRAAEAVACWVQAGIAMAMNRFNGVVPAPTTKTKDR